MDPKEKQAVAKPGKFAEPTRRRIEVAVGIALLAGTFAAIAASDVSESGMHRYWIILTVCYGVAALVIDRMHSKTGFSDWRADKAIVLHWVGVLAALQLAHFFVMSGRMADADAGLTKGLILALGMATSGAHGNWRLLLIGVAVGIATACVAAMEEYIWVLLGIAAVVILALVYGGRLIERTGLRTTRN